MKGGQCAGPGGMSGPGAMNNCMGPMPNDMNMIPMNCPPGGPQVCK